MMKVCLRFRSLLFRLSPVSHGLLRKHASHIQYLYKPADALANKRHSNNPSNNLLALACATTKEQQEGEGDKGDCDITDEITTILP